MASEPTRTGNDLTFGSKAQVVVVDGLRDFRQIPGEDPRRAMHVVGESTDPPFHDVSEIDQLDDAFGRFVVLYHDRTADRLYVQNDRYGMFPLFLVQRDGRLYLSTRLKPLVERAIVSNRLDPRAIADLFAFSVPLETRTPLAEVESLPAGTRLVIDLKGPVVSRERRWDPALLLAEASLRHVDVRDELVRRLLEGYVACTRHTSDVGITLSGGIDSRCLFAAGLHYGHSMKAYNASVPGSRSGRYAARMAEMVGVPFASHPVGLGFAASYADRLRGVIELTEGMTFSSEVECHWLSSHVEGPEVMIHGAFAELAKIRHLHSYWVDDDVMSTPRDQLPALVWNRFQSTFRANVSLLADDLRHELEPLALENLAARIEAVDPRLSSVEIMQVLYIEEFLGKVTKGSASVWFDRLPTRFPFAYPPFVDTLLRVRSTDRLKQHVQIDLLRSTSKNLLAFPDSNTGTRLGAPRVWVRTIALIDRIRSLLSENRSHLDHADRLTWLAGMRPRAAEILRTPRSQTILNTEEVSRLVRLAVDADPRSGFGPRAALRRREARKAALAIEKALLFQMWHEYIGTS